MVNSLLRVEDLSCERDDRLLFSSLSFSVETGDIVQVLGPNGAGKTTLLRMLAGLFADYEGRIAFQGESIENNPHYASQLLYLGHKTAIKMTLSPLENLRFLMGLQQVVSDSEIVTALASVGLGGYEDVSCHSLSAGQQRRVSLARLYLSNSPIWLLDEAFTAIDHQGVEELETYLAQRARGGTSIILTTHHRLNIASVRQVVLEAP